MNCQRSFRWTSLADKRLRALHANGYTLSGIAEILGCSRLDAAARSAVIGITMSTLSQARSAKDEARAALRQART